MTLEEEREEREEQGEEPLGPTSWREVEHLFDSLSGLNEPERAAALAAARAESPAVARHVARLLEAGRDASALLAEGGALSGGIWSDLEQHVGRRRERRAGERVGAYRILRELGRGGMGVVYLAERDDPDLPQRVALKVVGAIGDVSALVARFEQERRILATLSHPNVARFLDAGLSDRGEPYLVLELVEGSPITEACDVRRLGLAERVGLFVTVAEAVHGAHQKLIVHRDLKPSNILIDAEGRPKLLDFGIAKLLAGAGEAGVVPGAPALTRTQMRFLTPEYAAPEQVRGEPVTTATDVYQLGLLLYELLSGCRARRLENLSASTLERAVCEETPPAPSAAFSALPAATRREIAQARSCDPDRLRRSLRGDLDNVVLRAIATDPARRYGSVVALLADLERWREGRPVRARPATLGYRLGKFVRRNRFAVGAGSLLLLSLLAGLAGTLWQARAAARERDRALAAAVRAERVAELLIGIFEASDPEIAQGDDVSGRELLDRSSWRVDQELAGEPVLRAEMQGVLGRVYGGLGSYQQAQDLLERAVAELRAAHGAARDPALLASNLDRLAEVRLELDDDEGAETALREALALREPELESDPAAVAESLARLGHLRHWQQRYDEAEAYFVRALDLRQRAVGERHEATAQSLDALGWLLYERRRFEEAERLLRRALAVRREVLGERHPDVARSLDRLAGIESVKGNADRAEALYRESLELTRRVFGEDHPRTLVQQNNLAQMLIRRDSPVEAERLLRATERALAERLGEQHPYRATTLMNLGTSLRRQERTQEAIEVLQEAVAIRRAIRSEPQRATALALYTLALAHRDAGALSDAATTFAEALEILRRGEPADSTHLANTLVNFGDVLVMLGRLGEAEPLILEGLELRTAAYGPDHWITVMTRSVLGGLRAEQGRHAEARALLESSLQALREQLPDHAATRRAEARLTRFRAQGRLTPVR